MLGPRTGRENIHTLVRSRRALAKQGGVSGTSMGAALPPWVPAPPLWAPTSLLWVLALGTTTWVPTPPWRFRRPEELLSEARAKARAPVQGPQSLFWGSLDPPLAITEDYL